METVKDTVQDIFVEKKPSPKTGKTLYINKVLLEKFGPVSFGFTKPGSLGVEVGDDVTFHVEKDFGEWQFRTMGTAGEAATATAPPTTTSAPRATGGGGGKFTPKPFPVPLDHGDMSIIHQSALKAAIEYHASGMTGLDVPIDIDTIIETAYRFADFSSGQHLANLVKEDG